MITTITTLTGLTVTSLKTNSYPLANVTIFHLITYCSNSTNYLMARNEGILIIRKDHSLTTHLNLMLQAALPVYLGDITPTIIQIVVHTYRSYLECLGNIHKQNMMAIKSTALKNVNLNWIGIGLEIGDRAGDWIGHLDWTIGFEN